MHTKRANFIRTCLDILAMLLGVALLAVFLNATQSAASVDRQKSNSQTKLLVAERRLASNAADAESDLSSYDAFNQAKADAIRWYLDNSAAGTTLEQLMAQFQLDGVALVDAGGTVAQSAGFKPDLAAQDYALASLASGGGNVTQNGRRWYASALADGRKLLIGCNFAREDKQLDELRSERYALQSIRVGTTGYVASLRDGAFTYHPDESMIGQTFEAAGLSGAVLTDGFAGWVKHGDARSYCEAKQAGDVLLVAVVPGAELAAAGRSPVRLALVTFAAVVSLLVMYSLFLRGDRRKHAIPVPFRYTKLGGLYFNKTLALKVLPVAAFSLVLIFALSFYVQTLTALSRQNDISAAKLEAVTEILDDNAARIDALKAEYTEEYTRRAQNVAWLLAQDPSLVNDQSLAELAANAQVSSIFIINRYGRTVATNTAYKDFVLSDDPEAQSYPFWDVARGYRETLAQDAREDDTAQAMMQYVGVRRQDDAGMVQLGMLPKRLKSRLAGTELDHVLGNIAVENDGFLFAVDPATHMFLSYSNKEYIGRSAEDYGLTAAAFKDDATGFQTVDGQQCFVRCNEHAGVQLFVAVPTDAVYMTRLSMTALTTLGGAVVLLLLSAALVLSTRKEKPEMPEAAPSSGEAKPEPKGNIQVSSSDGRTRSTTSAATRWAGSTMPWDERTPEQKLLRLVYWAFCLASLVLVALSANHSLSDSSILSYIMELKWERNISVFSLTYIAVIVMRVWVISLLLRKLILALTMHFGARCETVGRLMDSFLKYMSIIVALFYGMNYIGIDSSTLMTSAGLLTLIVGLGSKALVSDILAGVFLVIEGEFRVGDIVTIGDWRGTVLEIGIRTTKIDAGGNIKIFNNSEISGVVNMTRQYSYASCDVGVEYGESLERVESILADELPKMRERLPIIQGGPFYKGVVQLGDSAVMLRIVAQCLETDRVQLCSDLNREIKLLFDRYEIGIPFPQVVVHEPAEYERATHAEHRAATEFVSEQKELSKGIEKS